MSPWAIDMEWLMFDSETTAEAAKQLTSRIHIRMPLEYWIDALSVELNIIGFNVGIAVGMQKKMILFNGKLCIHVKKF